MIHVAILHRRYLDLILLGVKTVESRLLRTRRTPYGMVRTGERVYFKESGGPFRATAVAGRVVHLGALTPADVRRLARQFEGEIRGGAAYWRSKSTARVATLVWLTQVRPIAFGPGVDGLPQWRPRQGWCVLPDECDVFPACATALPRLSGTGRRS